MRHHRASRPGPLAYPVECDWVLSGCPSVVVATAEPPGKSTARRASDLGTLLMAYGYGRCTNFDYCSVAESRKDIAAPTGPGFVCPECGKPLKVPSKVDGGNGRL